jgi:hypothetical protein
VRAGAARVRVTELSRRGRLVPQVGLHNCRGAGVAGDPVHHAPRLAPHLIPTSRMTTKTLLILSFVTPLLIGSTPSSEAAAGRPVVLRQAATFRPFDKITHAQGRPEHGRGATVNCGPHRRAVVRPIRLNGRHAERVVCVSASPRAVTRAPHRSWKKSALVIGGSSAAGAGVGALIGGGKGALIGGLAGGAAGTAYEVHKRHKVRRRATR